MTKFNERTFDGPGNQTGELPNTRLDVLPTAQTWLERINEPCMYVFLTICI